MKKMLLFIILLMPFIVYADSCSQDDIVIDSINLGKVFGRAKVVSDASVDGKRINLDLSLSKLDDSVEYSFTIKNVSNNDYLIDEDSLVYNSDYLDYKLVTDSNILKSGEEKSVKLIINYKDIVPDNLYVNNSYSDNNTIVINMLNEKNPNTKDYIFICGIILLVSLCLLIVLVIKKNKYSKLLLFIIGCSCLVPISVFALCKCNIEVDAKININKYVPNNMISAYPLLEDGSRDTSKERGYWQYKTLIENVYFRINNDISDLVIANNCGESQNELCSFDISENQNGMVMSYLVTNENNLYDLYIVADDYIYAPSDSYVLFGGRNNTFYFSNLKSINNLNYLLTDNVTDMSFMFAYSSNLISLDTGHFNTSNVTKMAQLFGHCTNLESVDVSGFDTSKVTSLNNMFVNDKKIDNLDVSNWDTSNVVDMYKVFRDCPSLKSLDLSKWDTSNVTNFAAMFSGDSSLTGLDISSFDTSKATNISQMFEGLSADNDIDFNILDVSNVERMSGVFRHSKYTTIDISSWNTSKVVAMDKMFRDCPNLTTIYVGDEWSIDNVTESDTMFFTTPNIVGQNGTVYNNKKTNKVYAVVDLPGSPGYLSKKIDT